MRSEHDVSFIRRICTDIRFEVLTAVVIKHCIISDIIPCTVLEMNRRFGWTYHLHIHGLKISQIRYKHEATSFVTCLMMVSCLAYSSALKMEAKCYSELPLTSNRLRCVTSQKEKLFTACTEDDLWSRWIKQRLNYYSPDYFCAVFGRHDFLCAKSIRQKTQSKKKIKNKN
jgi:hypothetical protein